MPAKTRDEHLFSPGPKRVLALDGGGIRGILSLQVLRKIEDILRARAGGDPDFRLGDYFDLIGGTSTGAIIAAGLAVGYSVDKLEELYKELGKDIFQSSILRWGILRAKFSAKPLEKVLKREFGGINVGDERIRTGLAVILKRLDTGSPWTVHNNPRGKYFGPRHGGNAIPNKDFPLWQIVRASTAAPHYFEPERFPVADDGGKITEGAFVDGGVSPHNNPALQLAMMAWLRGYGLQWPVGEDQLLVVSVGTGASELEMTATETADQKDAVLAIQSLSSLMGDAQALNELILQWMSASPTARRIDREMGNLGTDFIGGRGALLSYLRYNAWLNHRWLNDHAGLNLSDKQLKKLKALDEPDNMPLLIEVGKAAAREVEESHFPSKFDIAGT